MSERRVVHVFLMCCQGVAGEREAHLAGLRVRGLVKGLGFGEREADLAGLLHELADHRLRLTHLRHREGAHLLVILFTFSFVRGLGFRV